ncbi:MAG: nicotinamide-nucleotide amidohydrolase family protein [Bacilli bacterium]|nr:nicotinamide-nucleotide amidohydrolase family protein [Bacilli bacterium]
MEEVVNYLIKNNKTISVMESCTGGSVANSITNVPGASSIFFFGAVTYSNEYKIKLGVNKELIDKYTVYSTEVAKDMAKVISNYTNTHYGIGVTGKLNKPDPKNPYGDDNTVYISIYDKDNDKYYPKTIILKHENRIDNKNQIINEIKEILLKNFE